MPDRPALPPIILASASPRRRKLLAAAGVTITVISADADETEIPGEDPAAMVERLAQVKAEAIAAAHPAAIVLGSDTTVHRGGVILGKPTDRADAIRMITMLAGQTHTVYTGVCLLRREPAHCELWHATTHVTFRPLSAAEIETYVDTARPYDKAGAYGYQEDPGRHLVHHLDGLESTVIGLPVEDVLPRLARFP